MNKDFIANPAIESTISPSQRLLEPERDEAMNSITDKIRDGDVGSKLREEKGDLDVILFDSSFHQQFRDFLTNNGMTIVSGEDNRFIISANVEDIENTDKPQKIVNLSYVRRIDPYSPKWYYNEVAEELTKVSMIRNNDIFWEMVR